VQPDENKVVDADCTRPDRPMSQLLRIGWIGRRLVGGKDTLRSG
jgi:hypothetical protein